MKKVLLLSTLLLAFFTINAQLVNWQTGNGDPCAGTGNGTANATSDAACYTIVDLCRGTGINEANGGDFNSNGFTTGGGTSTCAEAIAADDCLTWGVTVAGGCSIPASSEIEFQLDRSGTGPGNYCLDIDIGDGNGFITISTGTISTSTGCVNELIGDTDIDGPITVTFRLCAWGASGASGTMDIEDGVSSCGGATDSGISLTAPVATPVTISTFTAKPMDNKAVTLDWSTASEENNEYFSIEHSTDGRDFVEVGMVPGAVNSSSMLYYNFTHDTAAKGVNYYRLRQVDTDGTFSFSAIEVVNLSADVDVQVRPTLAKNSLQLEVSKGFTTDVEIEVYNVLGQQVISQILESNTIQASIDVSNLQNGHYFVRINNGTAQMTTRFIKQ